MWTQRTRPVPQGTRPTEMEETNPYSGWPQRAISLRDIKNQESRIQLFREEDSKKNFWESKGIILEDRNKYKRFGAKENQEC